MLVSSTGLWMRSHAAWKIIRSNLHQSNRPRDENGRQYLSTDDTSVRSSLRQRASHQIERWHSDSSMSIMGMHKCRTSHVSLVEFTAAKAELRRQSASTTSAQRDSRRYSSLPFIHKYSWSIRVASSFQQQKFVSTPCFPPLMRGIEHIFVSNLQTVFGIKHT